MADTPSTKIARRERSAKEIFKDYPDYDELEVLHKPWYILAVVQSFMGYTYAEIAKNLGRNKNSVGRLCNSPAGKRLKAYLEEKIGDPVTLAKDMAKAHIMGVTTDWYMALEWAKEARDYKSVAQMTKDLAALGGLQPDPPKQEAAKTPVIRIEFGGKSLDTESVEASYEIVDDEEEPDDL